MSGGHERILRATAATLSWQPQGSDGEPVTADPGTVTVDVTNSAGTVVIAAGTATSGTGTAPRTIGLTVAQTAQLDVLTATWTISGVAVATTTYDIVGGYYFTAAELRDAEPSLGGDATTPTAKIVARRSEVETMFESLTGIAFVPRFTSTTVFAAQSDLFTNVRYLRSVRSVRQYYTNASYIDLDAGELAGFPPSLDGRLSRVIGWVEGARVRVGVEHGMDAPPPDVKAAAMTYCRYLIFKPKSGVPDRAVAMSSPDGGSFQLGRVGTEWRPTGVDSVDEVLRRPQYRARRRLGIG